MSSPEIIVWRILLFDDDEDDYFIIREILANIQGPHIELDWLAPDGEAARNACAKGYDACLVDHRLGMQDGLEVIRQIKQDCPEVAAILITGTNSPGVEEEALRAGADAYVSKDDFTTSIAYNLLKRLIRRYEGGGSGSAG